MSGALLPGIVAPVDYYQIRKADKRGKTEPHRFVCVVKAENDAHALQVARSMGLGRDRTHVAVWIGVAGFQYGLELAGFKVERSKA